MQSSFRTGWLWGLLGVLFQSWAVGADAPATVCVSIPPQAWLVKHVSGGSVGVMTLLPPGANPHTYEPTVKQMKELAGASLYLTVGIPFERPLAARVGKLNPALRIAATDAGIQKHGADAHDGHAHEHGEADHDADGCMAGGDPHIWLSPPCFCAMASNTAAALTGLLPAPQLAANLQATVAAIRAVDEDIGARLKGMTMRTWAVYHPSWHYFADRYGLSLLAIEQDGKAPSARQLARLVRETRSAGVKTVFTEPSFDRRPAQILADQIGAHVAVIDPLKEDWPALMRDVADNLLSAQPAASAVR